MHPHVQLGRCTLLVCADDQPPPHFHLRMPDGREALVTIDDLSILSCELHERELDDALAWAADHRDELRAAWQALNP